MTEMAVCYFKNVSGKTTETTGLLERGGIK